VTCAANEGSRRLRQAAAEAGAAAMRRRGLSEEERDERSRRARRLNLGRFLHLGYHGPRWARAQLRLLGKEPDDVVARKIGHSEVAVRVMRNRLGSPTALDRKRQG
jgi:hypothetical protein